MRFLIIIMALFSITICNGQNKIFKTTTGKILFVSNAPKEVIKAQTNTLMGVFDSENRNFSFKVMMKNFDGFNNPLQKEHFYENYIETDVYPEASFKGKIIEGIIPDRKQVVRAKGMLNIHGVSNEVLIEVTIEPKGNSFHFSSTFQINLEDYNINVPRIVSQKISKNVDVKVEGVLNADK